MKPGLCLGTAQFGLSYGVTNRHGRVKEAEVKEILEQAQSAGLEFIDTAQAYGSSEAVLGRKLPEGHNFRLISKMKRQEAEVFLEGDTSEWESNFRETCRRLKTDRLEGLLLHSANDLKKQGGHLLAGWLDSLRSRGMVKRIGISIYESSDLDGISDEMQDIIQLPVSLYDQRMISDGTINRLKSEKKSVFARSVYLQGLLLSRSESWPGWMKKDAKEHQYELEMLAREKGCRLIDLALGFARAQSDIEAVVVGICSTGEFNELIDSWTKGQIWNESEWVDWAIDDKDIVDPRNWPTG